MSPIRVLRGFILGAFGGVVAWMLLEFLPPPFPSPPFRQHLLDNVKEPLKVGPQDMGLLGAFLGLAVGGFLGLSEGMNEGTAGRFRRALLWFLGLGAVGGFLGMYAGQLLWGALGGVVSPQNPAQFMQALVARSLGWMLIGVFLGMIFGVPNLSVRRMWNGAVGGGIGGALGGFFLQTMTSSGLFQGLQGRFIGYTLMGAMIGFFINLIAEAMKRVWVKVLIGRNEGREHVLDTPVAYLGRDELADIPVFLDPAVPKRMASFRAQNGRYALYPESQALPILVNGEPLVPGRLLCDGDAIQFGRVTLAYNEKATATGLRRPVDSVPLADLSIPSQVPGATPLPTRPGVCEFCGQPRDPATGACACSVPAEAAAPAGGYAPGAYNGHAGYAADAAYAATVMDPGAQGGFAPPAGGGPRFTVVSGPYAGQTFPLQSLDFGIGRDPGQDLPLPADSNASRRHARVCMVQGGWMIRDEGSANGTWINGVRVQEQPLYPNDEIRIGQTVFRFEP